MANISSINFKKSIAINSAHNDRTLAPNYLISDEGAIFNRNDEEARILKKQIITNAKEAYKKHIGQKFQAKSYEWSAVVNLKPDSTMQDLEKLAEHFNKKYGFQCYQIAIHRDEGHINEQGEKIINHHAHLEFITLDKETGKTNFKLRDFSKAKMREIQSEVAEILQMERGQDKRQSKRQRIEPRLYAKIKEKEKLEHQKEREKIKELEQKEKEQKKIDNFFVEIENLQLKQKNEELEAENELLKGKNKKLEQELEQQILTQKQIHARIEQERKAWIEEKNHIAEEYRRLRALKNQQKITIEDLENQIKELNKTIAKERKLRENAESKRVEIESKIHAQTTQSVENQPQQPQSFTQENAQQKHIDNIDKLIDKVDKAKQQLEQEQEKPQQEPTFRKRTMRKSNTSFDLEM